MTYNRGQAVARVLDALRPVAPRRLWIAADGPRTDDPADAALCAESRRALEQIDWPCESERRFAAENRGCRLGVIDALDWFFGDVAEGIVLEDDCLPDPSFFPYCAELLEHYRDRPEVFTIAGANFDGDEPPPEASYYFSRYGHIWGWATWRRAWRLFDRTLDAWPEQRASGWLSSISDEPRFLEWWTHILDEARRGSLNTWDVQWAYTVFQNGGFAAIPATNLISNIGFDGNATHTISAESPFAAMPTRAIDFPLRHPARIEMVERCRLRPSRSPIVMHPFRPGQSSGNTPGGTAM